ncbi:unnamed protein product [Brassicogethes aeneus]|uniref:Uncharacterized protein n=1 Tax=Brassicogethes aeneus TaxID=1431903 RepID=A0A9P0FNS2_BRAAE|nr:unnamed protein product [Brassicogethes aeneus]
MDIKLTNNENTEDFVSSTGCNSINSPRNSLEDEESSEKNGNALTAKPTFKSVLQAKKRLQAFSSNKLLLASNSPKKTPEEIDKNDKISPKKAKKELYPDEKFKSTIKEIESIKMSSGCKRVKPEREILDEINKINIDLSKSMFSLSSTSEIIDADNHFRKVEVKTRNYRKTDEIKESSPRDEKKSHKSQKRDSYPKNWLEYKEQKFKPGKDSQLKTGTISDFIKFFTFETPSPATPDVKYKTERGNISVVPFRYVRQTKMKPHISFSTNYNTVKDSFVSKKQLMDLIPSARRELIEKLYGGSSKKPLVDDKVVARKWFPKSWKKSDNVEGKLLENSVGLSFLQSYSDEEDIAEETAEENVEEQVNTTNKVESPVKPTVAREEIKSKWDEDASENKKEDTWEVTTPPKVDKSQTPEPENDCESKSNKKRKKNAKKEPPGKKRSKKKSKAKKSDDDDEKRKKKKHKVKDMKERKNKKEKKRKKEKSSDDKESEERQKYIEDLIEQIDHVEKIKSKKEKEQKLKKEERKDEEPKKSKKHKSDDESEKKKVVKEKKRKRSKSNDKERSKSSDSKKKEKEVKESSNEEEESRTPIRPAAVKKAKTTTPDTEGYNSRWESEDEVQAVAVKDLNRSWESDEEVFERERRNRREKTPPTLDEELKLLQHESKSLSEERLRLEREKIKVQQLEMQYESLERKSKADKKKYEEIYKSYKVSKEAKPDYDKFEILDVDLSKVKLEVKEIKPNALENEYEEFMKAVTDKEVTPTHDVKLETTPPRDKKIDELTSTPKPTKNTVESVTLPPTDIPLPLPLPLPLPVPSPRTDTIPTNTLTDKNIENASINLEIPVPSHSSPIKTVASPNIDSNSFDIGEKKPFVFSIPTKKQLIDTKLNLDDEDDEEPRRLTSMEEINEIKKDGDVLLGMVVVDEVKNKEEIKKKDPPAAAKKKDERRRSRSPRRRSPGRRNRESPVRKRGLGLGGRRSRSPRGRRISSPRRKRSASPRHIKRRSKSPKRKLSPRRRSSSPRPKRRRSSPSKERAKSPSLGGSKKSVADSTISDDLLPQPSLHEEYSESPITRFNDRNRQSDSPKRPSLDTRINQLCGLQKQPPSPYEHHYGAYGQYQLQYGGGYNASSPNIQVPITKPQVNQVVQVGNMLQIVPTEDIPVPNVKPPTPQLHHHPHPQQSAPHAQHRQVQQIVQVGNMLQIVPQNLSPEMAEMEAAQIQPPPLPLEETSAAEKSSIEDVMKLKNAERRAEREKRRQERERRRKEKEKRRKEKEKQKQIKMKLRTENLIKKALQREEEEEEEYLEGEDDEPASWLTAPPSVVFDSTREAERSAMLHRGDCAAGDCESGKKRVRFADGVCPGEGTSPSGGEELSSPPPTPVKRLKKTKVPKKVKKKKIRVKVVKRQDESEEEDNLPPPSPPPGSPPPHLYPPRVKTHTINNIHPQQQFVANMSGGGAVAPPYAASAALYARAPPPVGIGMALPPPPPPQVVHAHAPPHVYQTPPPPPMGQINIYGAPPRPPPGQYLQVQERRKKTRWESLDIIV